ncbi:MAG: hypothetical protein ACLQK8_24135 [Streptosporangiaceae bacterium]
MENAFAAGDLFLLRQARLLERRLFAACFLGQSLSRVIDALRGYQNDGGGFGHALEPDKRCPASLPVDVEAAFQALATVGATDRKMVLRACDFLAAAAAEAGAGGGVPLAFPVIESFPRAEHWTEWTYQPGLNPTAGLAGLLYQLGVEHPWREQATRYCWEKIESGGATDFVHTLAEVLVFLEHVPDRDRANACAADLAGQLAKVPGLHLDPGAPGYGLTPLQLAPAADSRWRRLFTDEQISAHLDQLERSQQADGGWPVSWQPPSEASLLEWRGIVTLQALRTLTSYGRLAPAT